MDGGWGSRVSSLPVQPLQPLFRGEMVPAMLKKAARWAPWRAKWNAKRGKWDKIPCYPTAPYYGISTAKPDRWVSFDAALAGLAAQPDRFAGLGYCMTGAHGVVGIDLDRCVDAGVVAPWAREIVDALGTYAERSPSGLGLRMFVRGEILSDWTNHDIGIEVYAGHEPRFLTVTGDHLAGTPVQIAQEQPGVLAQLAQRYARERSDPAASLITLQMPGLVDELLLPDLATLGLPYGAMDFLAEGTARGDRSRELFAAAVALHQAGLDAAEVFSVLAQNPHALEVALDHRRQDHDRALRYLWVEHAQKAKGKGTSRVATLDDFDVVGPTTPPATKASPRPRFAFDQAAAFSQRKPVEYLIKDVLPRADVGAVFGESGAGKSFLALDLCMAVARGGDWRGRRVKGGAVAYVCAEGAGGFTVRLKAYAEHHGLELEALPLFVLGDAPNILQTADVKDLLAALRTIPGLALVVLDTLAQVTAGANENSGEDMGRALGHCKAIAQGTRAMVLLVAHAGKDADRGLRGWSGIKGALDVEILVERSDNYRAATITKMKDGKGEGDEFPFSLVSVTLGQDQDGDDITSCVLAHGQALPKEQRRVEPKGNVEKLVLRTATVMRDLSDGVTTQQLIDAVVNEMVAPEAGKRDRRREMVMRALESLAAGNHLSLTGGAVNLLSAAG